MALIYTSLTVRWIKKESCFLIETKHEHDGWTGGMTGGRIYQVGSYLVMTGWGHGKPVAVFENKTQMMSGLEEIYGIAPVEILK